MLTFLLRWIFGYVDFKIIGKFPERFLNITINNGIKVWDANPENGVIFAKIAAGNYKNIRPYAKKARVRLKLADKHGLPFFISAHKTRLGILIGMVCFIIVLSVLSKFVWVINIDGNTTISETYMRKVLSDNGLTVGMKLKDVKVYSIPRMTTLEIDKIAWMSVNMKGCVANVEIKEKAVKPSIDKEDSSYNIKAKKDGIILTVEAHNGNPVIKPGSGVSKGQLLVSGIVEDKNGGNMFVGANAVVMAQTEYTKNFTVKKQTEQFVFDDKINTRNEIVFLWWNIPFSFTRQPTKSFYSQFESRRVNQNDVKQPIGYNRESMIAYNAENISYDKKTFDKLVNDRLRLYEIFDLGKCEKISPKLAVTDDKKQYNVECKYTCNEDIAVREKIDITDFVTVPDETPTEIES